MNNWQVQSFRRTTGTIYNRSTTEQNVYIAGNQRMNGMQFMCNGEFTVYAVTRAVLPAAMVTRADQQQPTLFTIGDLVRSVGLTFARIIKFNLIDSDTVMLVLDDANTLTLNSAQKQVVVPATSKPADNPATEAWWKSMEDRILRQFPRAIRLEKTMKKTARDLGLKDFLVRYFEEYNKKRATIYVDTEEVQTNTQGGNGRRRSIGDMFMIVRYYFPEVTLKEVAFQMYQVLPTHFTKGYRTSYCSTVNKRVWYLDHTARNEVVAAGTQPDEYGLTYNQWLEKF